MVYEQWSVVKEDGDAYSSPTDALYPLNFFSQMLLRPPPNLSSIFLFLGVYVQKPLARLEQPTTRLRRVLDSRSVIRIFILENFILGSPSGLILDKGRYDRIDQSSKRISSLFASLGQEFFPLLLRKGNERRGMFLRFAIFMKMCYIERVINQLITIDQKNRSITRRWILAYFYVTFEFRNIQKVKVSHWFYRCSEDRFDKLQGESLSKDGEDGRFV